MALCSLVAFVQTAPSPELALTGWEWVVPSPAPKPAVRPSPAAAPVWVEPAAGAVWVEPSPAAEVVPSPAPVHYVSSPAAAEVPSPAPEHYDAIIIAGGGLEPSGAPLPWVLGRLDAAINRSSEADFFLALSRGTTHEPPPLDANGFPIDEAKASADYLVAHGIEPKRVLQDTWSLDTIGNAAFARLMHAEPRGWQRLMVVTSDWHMNRTRAIFEWVFSLPPTPSPPYKMEYVSSPAMMEGGVLLARSQREAESLAQLQEGPIAKVTSLKELHAYLFANHSAYAAAAVSYDAKEDAAVAASYKGSGGGGGARQHALLAERERYHDLRRAEEMREFFLGGNLRAHRLTRAFLPRAQAAQRAKEAAAGHAMWEAISK
jgi:hypothetical protein